MSCNFPITGYRTGDGKVTLNRSVGYYDRAVSIACGQCRGCRLARAQAWAVRCVHEAQTVSESGLGSSFVTLTYDEANVPKDRSLRVEDLQKFVRRMRDAGRSFRYYACGEYGPTTLRPHYHALLFGLDFRADRIAIGVNEFGDRKYISEELNSFWSKGHCELGSVSWRSAAYCSGYIVTKGHGDDAVRKYRRCDGENEWWVKPEFAVMSRRPGIGTAWFEKYGKDVFPSDFVVHEGRRRRVPKFYDSLIAESDLDVVKAKRVVAGRKSRSQRTPERLAAREFILENQCKLKEL